MELHTCTNCELINEVISKEVQRYDMLTEENVALHGVLIKAREKIASLESEVAKLYDAVTAERQRNLELYMKQLSFTPRSEVSMNVIVNSGRKEPEHKSNFSLIRRTATRPSTISSWDRDEQISVPKYNTLKSICENQARIYEDNLQIMQRANENYISKLKEQMNDSQSHLMLMMEMYSKCRSELFKQKQKNVDERKQFLETTSTLHRANAKYIQAVEKKMLSNNAGTVTEQIKEFLNLISHQIQQREKLVATLRRQQVCLEEQIDQLQKQEVRQQEKGKKETEELRKQLRHFHKKYSALEQRRVFDAEGFRTDVNDIRKILTKFKKFTAGHTDYKCDLLHELQRAEQKVDKLDKRVHSCYAKES